LITKQLLEQIEGEASVYFDMKEGKVDFATVAFTHFRGMENILKGKSALDALVITPRVCGICGHAHLMATARALEDAYRNAGHPVTLTLKAQKIREFTLLMEMVQNHFKWLYMVILPQLAKLRVSQEQVRPLKGAYAASLATKAIATFAGQWPHSSYMLPGGVTCDPTHMELFQAQNHLSQLIDFFEKESLGISLEAFLAFESCKDFNELSCDIARLESDLITADMHHKGMAKDQFLVMGVHGFTKVAKCKKTRIFGVENKHVSIEDAYVPQSKSYAKNALYKGEYYESGPLARMMTQALPVIRNMHRRYKDSAYTRIMARIFELAYVLNYAKGLLSDVDVMQTSVVQLPDIKNISTDGVGVVEAPRGPLLHKVSLKQGVIQKYTIITPTQFNIGSAKRQKQTPVQTAMQGCSQEEALFIFRTFDVCSVCTTH
jgi:Ni,Fe-hydrogenase I large subunit